MQEFYNYIAQAFQDGIKYGGGSTSAQTKLLSEIITDNVAGFTTKLGNDIKADALKIIDNGIKSSSSASDIAFQLESQLEMTAARARAIARTETMRSSNTASYVQAKANGMTHYTVDYADDACDECVELYQDEVFSIDDQENIPPVHPNCRCVPVYFNDKDEAKEWSDMITEDVNNANETREASKEE
jgi:SPP1 gp7 family putative phage head morphogenesis protein